MGVLGSQDSGQVASWDTILCLQVMAGAEGGQAVKSLAHSPFLFLCVLPVAPPGGCTITRAEFVISQSCAVVHPEKGLDYSTQVSRSFIRTLLCSRSKRVERTLYLFYNLPTGHMTLAITLISVDGLSTEVLACLYLENNKRCIRWKN